MCALESHESMRHGLYCQAGRGEVVVEGKEFNECNVLAKKLSVSCLCTGVK